MSQQEIDDSFKERLYQDILTKASEVYKSVRPSRNQVVSTKSTTTLPPSDVLKKVNLRLKV